MPSSRLNNVRGHKDAFRLEKKKKWVYQFALLLMLLSLVFRLQGPQDWSANSLIISDIKEYFNSTTAVYDHHQAELSHRHHQSSSLVYSNTDQSKVTLVTAFFPLEGSTRHTLEEYMEYMTKLFSNNDAMVIFTSHQFEPTVRHLLLQQRHNSREAPQRRRRRAVIVPMNLNETKSWQMFTYDFWYHDVFRPARKIRSLGSNRGILVDHLPYVVWNSKVEFLKLASNQNPFQSDFFVWMDAGFVRWDRYTNSTIVQRIPPNLSQDKLLIMDVTPILSHKKYKQMSAGMFGGYKPAIDRFYEKYYQIMEQAGNSKDAPLLSTEQFLLHRTCLRHQGLCHVIVPMQSKTLGSPALQFPYFYMLAFFNTMEYQTMESNDKIHPCNGIDNVERLQKCVENFATKSVLKY